MQSSSPRTRPVRRPGSVFRLAATLASLHLPLRNLLASGEFVRVWSVAGLKRNEQNQEFDGAALSALFAAPDQGFAYSLDGDGKSAHVMQVIKDVLPPLMATPSEEAKKMQADMKGRLVSDLQAGFVSALRQNAKVTLNEELWRLNTRGGTQQQPQ